MTFLTLWQTVLRKLTPAEVDANFTALRTTADAAVAALGGFSASQTPGVNQIVVVKADASLALPGALSVVGISQVTSPNTPNPNTGAERDYAELRFVSTGVGGTVVCGSMKVVQPTGVYADSCDFVFKSNNGLPGMRFTSTETFLVGVASAACHTLAMPSANVDGAKVLAVKSFNTEAASFHHGAMGGADLANVGTAVLKVGKASSSYSLRLGGAIGASGADYAEYERKAITCGGILRGQIIGFDQNGEVTDRWAQAISFGVKSTDPNLVGGDTWGSADVIGKRPEQPIRTPDSIGQREITPAVVGEDGAEVTPAVSETVILAFGDTDEEWAEKEASYATELTAFETRLEIERQKVDRIAYSGKVPCNVKGAAIGDYIVAVQCGDGIAGLPVAEPTFSQYRAAVGRVRRILDDGRPEIAVMMH